MSAKSNFDNLKLISTFLIIIPLGMLGYDYFVEKRTIYQCESNNGTYNYKKNTCDINLKQSEIANEHVEIPYHQRQWARIVITEILLITGFFMKLIIRRKEKPN